MSERWVANYAKQSQLAGIPIKAGIGNIANPGNSAKSTLDAMGQGLKSGATSVGLQMATEALHLDPLAGSVITRALSGAISGAISPSHNVFKGVYDAFRDSVGNFSTIPPPPDPEDPRFITTLQNGSKIWNRAAYEGALGQYEAARPVWMAQAMAKTNNFSDEIREFGFGQAIENYATSIFHRDSVESIVQSFGSFKDAITERIRQGKVQDVTLEDGRTHAKKVSLSDDEKIDLLLNEDPFGDISLLGITEDDLDRRYQEIRADRGTNTAGMTQGTITRTYRSTALDGTTVTAQVLEEISASGVSQIKLIGSDGSTHTITPNNFQHIQLNADGTIRDGVIHTLLSTDDRDYGELRLSVGAGEITPSLSADLPQGVSVEQSVQILNQIGNKLGDFQRALWIPPAYADNTTHQGDTPPQDIYAIRIFADRPGGNGFGDDKVGIEQNGAWDVGHTFVAIANKDGNISRVGLYPAPGSLRIAGNVDPNNLTLRDVFNNLAILRNVGGLVIDDSRTGQQGTVHDYDAATDWFVVSESQYEEIIQYVNKDHSYNLAFHSCTGFALDIAKLAGVELPYKDWFFSNPQDLADAIERMHSEQ